jgi:tetratricopeptide (TPR) repeat protein
MARAFVVSLLVAGLSAAPAAQVRPRGVTEPSGRFLSLWSMYRRGDADAAVDAFSKWKPKEVAAEAMLPSTSDDPWSRAALATFHTEAGMRNNTFARWSVDSPSAFNLSGWGLAPVYEVHAYHAFLLVKDLTAIGKRTHDDRLVAYARSWYIIAISYSLRWRLRDAMLDLWDLADHDFGDDPEMRLLIGSIAESRSMLGGSGHNSCFGLGFFNGPHGCIWISPTTGAGGPGHGQEALFEFRHALKEVPTLTEARLRLGRMLHLIGRNDEAREALTRALAEAQAAHQLFTTYMAALFLGEIDEEAARDLPAAISHYRIAVDALPFAHYGRLMLGQAMTRSGNEEGWLEMRRMFDGEAADHPQVTDPYGIYQFAQYWQIVSRLRDMRGEIRQ